MTSIARPAAGVRDLTKGPVARTLLTFAMPTLASSVLQSLGGSVNSMWVGRFLGEDALAATINGNMVSFLLMALAFGTGMSATIFVGRAIGAGDLIQARRTMGTAMGAFAAISVAVAILGWLAAPYILHLLGTPPTAARLALGYLRMTFFGVPGALLGSLLMMGLRGVGDALSPMWFTVATVALDVVLNPILILGLGPAPALGVTGAAMALSISGYISCAAILGWIYWKDLPIRLKGAELSFLKPDPALLSEIVRKGLPMGLQMIAMTMSAMTILHLVNREGVSTTAAYGVVQQLWGYVQMPAMAVAAGVSALTAQAIGAKVWDRVKAVVHTGVVASLVLTLAITLSLQLADKPVIAVFVGAHSPIVPIAEHILRTTWLGFICLAISLILFASLRADGVVIRPLIITCVAMFGVRLGFAYGAYPLIGSDALWLSLTAGQVATLCMAIPLYFVEVRRRHRPKSTVEAEVDLMMGVEDSTVG